MPRSGLGSDFKAAAGSASAANDTQVAIKAKSFNLKSPSRLSANFPPSTSSHPGSGLSASLLRSSSPPPRIVFSVAARSVVVLSILVVGALGGMWALSRDGEFALNTSATSQTTLPAAAGGPEPSRLRIQVHSPGSTGESTTSLDLAAIADALGFTHSPQHMTWLESNADDLRRRLAPSRANSESQTRPLQVQLQVEGQNQGGYPTPLAPHLDPDADADAVDLSDPKSKPLDAAKHEDVTVDTTKVRWLLAPGDIRAIAALNLDLKSVLDSRQHLPPRLTAGELESNSTSEADGGSLGSAAKHGSMANNGKGSPSSSSSSSSTSATTGGTSGVGIAVDLLRAINPEVRIPDAAFMKTVAEDFAAWPEHLKKPIGGGIGPKSPDTAHFFKFHSSDSDSDGMSGTKSAQTSHREFTSSYERPDWVTVVLRPGSGQSSGLFNILMPVLRGALLASMSNRTLVLPSTVPCYLPDGSGGLKERCPLDQMLDVPYFLDHFPFRVRIMLDPWFNADRFYPPGGGKRYAKALGLATLALKTGDVPDLLFPDLLQVLPPPPKDNGIDSALHYEVFGALRPTNQASRLSQQIKERLGMIPGGACYPYAGLHAHLEVDQRKYRVRADSTQANLISSSEAVFQAVLPNLLSEQSRGVKCLYVASGELAPVMALQARIRAEGLNMTVLNKLMVAESGIGLAAMRYTYDRVEVPPAVRRLLSVPVDDNPEESESPWDSFGPGDPLAILNRVGKDKGNTLLISNALAAQVDFDLLTGSSVLLSRGNREGLSSFTYSAHMTRCGRCAGTPGMQPEDCDTIMGRSAGLSIGRCDAEGFAAARALFLSGDFQPTLDLL